MKIRVFIFNLLQDMKKPLYQIPNRYGRIIYGRSIFGVRYVWRNRFWPWMYGLYFKVDTFQINLLRKGDGWN